jgi:uncharacterized protein
MLSDDDGKYLIKIAKLAIENYLENGTTFKVPKDVQEHLKENLGVFVTLNKDGELRGCIGYPEPVAPLIDATIHAAISAAINDPRFPSLTKEELKYIDVEVTVLTKPQVLKVDDSSNYPNEITVGKDGLIVENGFNKGLLLPQVATEYDMDSETFLANTCVKAGLDSSCWTEDDTKVYTFRGQIFK